MDLQHDSEPRQAVRTTSSIHSVLNAIVNGDPPDPRLLAALQVSIEVPAPFRSIPVEGIEMTGRKVLQQLLRLVLPRFLLQVRKLSVGLSLRFDP